MPLGTEVGLGPGHIVLDGDPAPSAQKWGHSPEFSAHVYCAQTAGWTKMPPNWYGGRPDPIDIVLDGDPPLPNKVVEPPIFGPCLLWAIKRLHGSRCHLVWRYASAQATTC